MKTSFRLSQLSAITVAFFFSLAVSPAAHAVAPREIPAGEHYYALPCSWNTSVTPSKNLNSVSFDGSSAPVGDVAHDGSTCLADGSYNVVDGYYYAYDWNQCSYVAVNVRTGEQEFLGGITYQGSGSGCEANGTFVDQEGNHYLFTPSDLYAIDLGDMSMTRITDQLPLDNVNYITSMSYNPVDDTYYAMRRMGEVYEIDLSDGSVSLVDTISACDLQHDCWGLEFDSSGTAWIQRDKEGEDSHVAGLYSTTLDDLDGNWVSQGAYTDPELGAWYGESNFIAPDVFPWDIANDSSGSPLAATGFNALVPAGLATAVVLAGVAVTVRRRKA